MCCGEVCCRVAVPLLTPRDLKSHCECHVLCQALTQESLQLWEIFGYYFFDNFFLYFLFSFWNYLRQVLDLYLSSESHHFFRVSFCFSFWKTSLTLFSNLSIDLGDNFSNSIFNFQGLF